MKAIKSLLIWPVLILLFLTGGCSASKQVSFSLNKVTPYTASFGLKVPKGVATQMVRTSRVPGDRPDTFPVFGNTAHAGFYRPNKDWTFSLIGQTSGKRWKKYQSVEVSNQFPWKDFSQGFSTANDTVIIQPDILPRTASISGAIVCGSFSSFWQTMAINSENGVSWRASTTFPASGNRYVRIQITLSDGSTAHFILLLQADGTISLMMDSQLNCLTGYTRVNPSDGQVWKVSGVTISALVVDNNVQIVVTTSMGSTVESRTCDGCLD